MNFDSLIALIVATAIMGLVPGPVVAALVGRALFGGIRATFGFLFGVFAADLIWVLAAVSGLGYLAATYSMMFLVIKYIGALYLVYLGVQAIRQALQKNQEIKIPTQGRKGMGFASGFLVTLGNPKLVAFYIGFLPTFIDMEALGFTESLLAAVLVPSTFALVNFGWAVCAHQARGVFRSATPMRALNVTSGTLLIGAGGVMLAND